MILQDQIRVVVARKTDAMVRRLVAAEAETIEDARAEAIALSSGPFSLAELTAMGHPYARRVARLRKRGVVVSVPVLPPEVINVQTGAFRAAWRTKGPMVAGETVTTTLTNDDPAARWMAGTSKMVPRPVLEAVKARVVIRRRERLRRAINGN